MYPGFFAARTPEKPAVIMGSGEVQTYKELDDRSMQLAQLLHDRGLRRGDRIAILAENVLAYMEVYWAAVRSGLYISAINRHLGPEEASYIVANSQAQVLISTIGLGPTAREVYEGLSERPAAALMIGGTADGFDSYEAALACYPAEPLEEQWRGGVMLYSSGTTGRPKGVLQALPDLKVDEPGAGQVSPLAGGLFGVDESTVYLSPAPLYHAAPLQWSGAVHELGGTVVVMEKFDAEGCLALVERYGVTHSQLVPTMFVRMLKLPEEVRRRYDLSSLQHVLHAGAPCPREVKLAMIDWWGPIVSEYYSSTEGNCFTFITAPEWLAHPGSVGKSLLGEPHVCDDDGNELPVGEIGVLYGHRPDFEFEYHGDAEGTASTRHPSNPEWTTLGDIGFLDEDGYLYLTDRVAFMIISGGVNIYPAEIESCLINHPAVADVAVFGLPDPEMGQVVQAVIQPAADVEPSDELAEALRAYAREHLAGFKVPKHVDFRSELPRLPTGKLAKGPLQAEYASRLASA